MSIVQLTLLGPPQIYRDHQPVDFKIAKMQALLAYLASTRQPQRRDHLLALLWAESHPEAARKNLRNRLWLLRQTLGQEVIVAVGDTLALAPTVWSDVVAFETGITAQLQQSIPEAGELSALLDLWRGPLLAGLQLNEAPDFELWLTTERARLSQLYRHGLTALLANHQAAGDWGGVEALAQRGLQHDPWHEPFHQQLMRAYAHQGARGEALRHFDHLHVLLTETLAVEPLAETIALRQAILHNELAPAPQSIHTNETDQRTALSSANPASIDPAGMNGLRLHPLGHTVSAPFIGRQSEFDALDQAVQQTSQGHSQVVVLSGELGIGKTRLWQMWTATSPVWSTLPAPVLLESRCLNTTQSVPFDPVRRLLNSQPVRTHFMAVADQLLPVWRDELLHLAPGLQPTLVQATTPPALPPTEERGLLAEALTQFLRSFDARPLIFFVDDLHWADAATLNWLLYLTDRLAAEPFLLIGAYRPEDAQPALTRLLAQWQREGVLQRLPLPRLTSQEASDLLNRLDSNINMADYLYSQSGGNPYYLTQLSDVVVDGIPATLAELVRARLSYLPENLLSTLQTAAILEPAINLEILRQTSQRSEEETLDALDGLLAAAVLVEQAGNYEFSHPLVATVVRDGLSSGRRRLLHRRAAVSLTTHYADQLPTVAGQLARHYAEAGETLAAASFAEMAGDEALRIGAAAEAAAFYQQAITLTPTPERQLALGHAYLLLPGKMAEARIAMQQALTTYETAENYQGRVKAGLRLAASYLAAQEGAQVLYWAQRILPDLETVEDVTLHASAHYLMGTAKFRNGYGLAEAAMHYAEATRLVTEHQLESEIALMSWFEWGNLCLEQGDYPRAAEKFQVSRQVAQASQSLFFEALCCNNLAYALLLQGDIGYATQWVERGLALGRTYALFPAQQYLYSTQGEILLTTGQFAAADQAFHQALALAEKYDNLSFAANVRGHLGRVAQARGELDAAQQWLITAQAALPGGTARYLQTQLDLWLADLQWQRGERAAATENLQRAEAHLDTIQNPNLHHMAKRLRSQLS